MGTGVALRVCSPGKSLPSILARSVSEEHVPNLAYASGLCLYQEGSDKVGISARTRGPDAGAPGPRINAVKRSAVSTGKLRRLLALHIRPIDQVVFLEPSLPKQMETSSGGGFHA